MIIFVSVYPTAITELSLASSIFEQISDCKILLLFHALISAFRLKKVRNGRFRGHGGRYARIQIIFACEGPIIQRIQFFLYLDFPFRQNFEGFSSFLCKN